jgi:CPA2 family monovalent cation:H+ antiporter-2
VACDVRSPSDLQEWVLPHDTPLIATLVAGLGLAFSLGVVAHWLRLPPIAGYLLAGVLIGPFTPGFVADQKLANELAEVGIILLMFGVGLHFSLKDLLAVRAVAIPGALGQIIAATLMGVALALGLGWTIGAGIVFGLSLSVASTVVLLRALQSRRLVESERGRIAVGWLIVEDIVMVLTLVLLPPLAGFLGGEMVVNPAYADLADRLELSPLLVTLVATALKLFAFAAFMLIVGRRVIPRILHHVAHSGSRELFRLSALVLALGVAFGSAMLFGVSFALGAFFAGMVMAESPLSTQAARDTLPLRDAFAVLFFVSVGMLFNPAVLVDHPIALLATFLIIVLGKSLAAFAIVRMFGHKTDVALTISASLAQIGEFSFILVALGLQLSLLEPLARDLVVGGALLSILLNPLLFFALDRYFPRESAERPSEEKSPSLEQAPAAREETPTGLTGHGVLVGHGRVGSRVSAALERSALPFLVIEESAPAIEDISGRGVETFVGTAGEKPLLDRVNLAGARWLVSAIPNAFEAGQIIELARSLNPSIHIIARAETPDAVEYMRALGANTILVGEEEIARSMIREIQSLDDVRELAARAHL